MTEMRELLERAADSGAAADAAQLFRNAAVRARRLRRRRRVVVTAVPAVLAVVAIALWWVQGGTPSQQVSVSPPPDGPPATRAAEKPDVVTGGTQQQGEWPVETRLFSDGSGWLITDHRLLHTDDGGVTWAASSLSLSTPVPAAANATAAAIVDGQHAWVVVPDAENAQVLIMSTSDGGRFLITDVVSIEFTPAHVSIDFVDANTGFLGISDSDRSPARSVLLSTTDGGHFWQVVARDGPASGLRFSSATDGWATGKGLHRTSDGGHSWTQLHPPGWDRTGGPDPAAPTYDIVWKEGRRGVVQSSYSGGNFVSIAFLETSDNGETWRDITPPDLQHIARTGPQPHLAVVGPNRFRVLVDGVSSAAKQNELLTSDDGGVTWSSVVTDVSFTLSSLWYTSPDVAWLTALPVDCGDEGCGPPLWQSQDGGRSWVTVDGIPGLRESSPSQRAVSVSSFDELVGVEYFDPPPLPPGAVYLGGGLLGDIDAIPVYRFGHAQQGDTLAIWFDVAVAQAAFSPNSATWRTLDVVTVDVGQNSLRPDTCFINGEYDTSIVAVIVSPMNVERQRPTYAWRFNTATQHAEALDVRDIACDIPHP